jgi:hypothetical protein
MGEFKTTREMLYHLKVVNLPFFTKSEDFKNFIKLSVLEKGVLEGNFSFANKGFSPGSGHLINRNYNVLLEGEKLGKTIYSEENAIYDKHPSSSEIFNDMGDNLRTFCEEDMFVSIDPNGHYSISK